MPAALGQEVAHLPPHIREAIVRARASWLKNSEVFDMLQNYKAYRLPVGTDAPNCPGGGCLFLFNRRKVRFFRKDGHKWRKKTDGKTVRETHEKLKIGNKDMLNCYYAHAEAKEALQRRCYWLLHGDADIVLVHYLSSDLSSRITAAATSSSVTPHPAADGCSTVKSCAPSSFGSDPRQVVTITTGEALLEASQDSSDLNPSRFKQGGLGTEAGCSSSRVGLSLSDAAASRMSTSCPETLDRASSIGPLHSAPSFSFGTVQTGSTVENLAMQQQAMRQDSRQSTHSGSTLAGTQQEPASRLPSDPGSLNWREKRCVIRIPPAHQAEPVGGSGSQHEGAAVLEEPLSSEAGHYELKPAVSLTRVDSDTLKVAPSLSGATCAGNVGRTSRKQDALPERPSMPSSVFSPFYAAALSGKPIGGLIQDSPHLASMLFTGATGWGEDTADLPCDLERLGLARSKRLRSEACMPMALGALEPLPFLSDALGICNIADATVADSMPSGSASGESDPAFDWSPFLQLVGVSPSACAWRTDAVGT